MKIILALWLDFKKFYFFTHYLNQIDFTFDILPALQDQKEKNIYIWLRSCKHNILVVHAF